MSQLPTHRVVFSIWWSNLFAIDIFGRRLQFGSRSAAISRNRRSPSFRGRTSNFSVSPFCEQQWIRLIPQYCFLEHLELCLFAFTMSTSTHRLLLTLPQFLFPFQWQTVKGEHWKGERNAEASCDCFCDFIRHLSLNASLFFAGECTYRCCIKNIERGKGKTLAIEAW